MGPAGRSTAAPRPPPPSGAEFAVRVRAGQEPWLGFGTGTGHRVVVLATFPAAAPAALATSGVFGERFAAAASHFGERRRRLPGVESNAR